MKLVFVHGWGFDAGLWRELVPRLPGHEAILIDLGFLREGPKGASSIPPDAVCIGHSFGVLWLLKHGTRPMRGLVSIAGFDCLHKYVPAEVFAAMREGLRRDAQAQMRAFWQACGIAEPEPDRVLDTGTLRGGLGWLASWDASDQRGTLGAPILALASEDDRIVRRETTEAVWGDGGDTDLRWRSTGGHILPLTEPEWCAVQIREFLDDLDR